MSMYRCLPALVFLGSIVFLPVALWADAIHTDPSSRSICDAVAGNLVKNCGFETGDFSDWNVKLAASGSFIRITDLVVNSGNFAIVFGATGATDDSISQVLSTTAGRAFHLSFFLVSTFGAPPEPFSDFSASWDGNRIFSSPTTSPFPFTKFSFVVPGTGSDTLQFAGRNPLMYTLDDIVVIPTITRAVIPEPSTLSLFGLGLLLAGALLARKKKLLNGAQA